MYDVYVNVNKAMLFFLILDQILPILVGKGR